MGAGGTGKRAGYLGRSMLVHRVRGAQLFLQ